MKTSREIIDEVQASIDSGFEELDFADYIEACESLTDEEKEWGRDNLGVRVVVEEI